MPIAATRGHQLVKDVNQVLENSPRYIPETDFWFRRTLAEAEKLKSVNRGEAHNVLAQLYGLAGNASVAEHHIDTAIRLSHDPAIVCNKAVILSNMGFFSAARKSFVESVDPELGLFTARWKLGICAGCMHTLAEFLAKARRMNLENLNTVDAALITDAVQLMDEITLTDEVLAHALDVAGEVLREQRLFFVGDGPQVSIWNDDPLERHLGLIFKLSVSTADAIALDEELGHRLFEKCSNVPPELMIHFESVKPKNEHYTERPAVTG